MRLYKLIAPLGLLALPIALAPATAIGAALQLRFGTHDRPFEGRSYETMRTLARDLDERAQRAAGQSIDDSHHGTRDEKKFVDSVTQFCEKAREFRTRMDRYREDPWDVPDEVDRLNDEARKVNDRIRKAHVFEATWDDWDGVLEVLSTMNRVIAGQDVDMPRSVRPGRVEPPPVSGRSERSSALLTGRELDEFRRLALDLDEDATRARRTAEGGVARSAGGRDFLRDIEDFNEQTHDLAERTRSGDLRISEIGPTVDDLLRDARRTDESLRSARVFPEVWETWTRTIRTLERMADLVR